MKVRYFIPSNLNLSPTSSHSLPLLKMDSETSDKIQLTVVDILNSSDIDSITEQQVRHLTSQKLGLDLSDLPHKILVRQVIESFLLSIPDHPHNAVVSPVNVPASIDGALKEIAIEEEDKKPVIKETFPDSCRAICKLSRKRDVAVRRFGGKTVVSIRELNLKDEKASATPKCINLFPDQWSIIRKSAPAIEDAIAKVESRLRSEIENKQPDDKHNISSNKSEYNDSRQSGGEPISKVTMHHRPGLTATRERAVDASNVASTPPRLVPIEIIRFNGKNYLQWADRMESYLNQLKVAYVLFEPCPSAAGVDDKELGKILSGAEGWMDDDHICRQNILNSLCDNLFRLYCNKSGTAKDLWEELKLMYLHDEYGAKVSLVKKYIEFQIVEEKSIFEQVHEFHQIADALNASGMYVEEKFHVNVVISKLPPSWKPISIQLMKEDYLPVWKLMNHLKTEEESRLKGNKGEEFVPRVDLPVFQPFKKLGPQRIPMKKPGAPHVYHEADRDMRIKFCNICKKKGHYSEQCWFRTTEGKDTTNEKDSAPSANANGDADHCTN